MTLDGSFAAEADVSRPLECWPERRVLTFSGVYAKETISADKSQAVTVKSAYSHPNA